MTSVASRCASTTFYQTLVEIVAWLAAEGVRHVSREATGVYWRPVSTPCVRLHRPLEMLLVNARHVCNVPGRKSDALDAVWLAKLTECGLLWGQLHPAAADRGDPEVDALPHKAHRAAHQ
ncbi:MAG: hypothetical protein JOZ48_06860 [Acidobacteriaceae bacterium]|nr:hypothetical protein [Acidobacteriaceae bacterium]